VHPCNNKTWSVYLVSDAVRLAHRSSTCSLNRDSTTSPTSPESVHVLIVTQQLHYLNAAWACSTPARSIGHTSFPCPGSVVLLTSCYHRHCRQTPCNPRISVPVTATTGPVVPNMTYFAHHHAHQLSATYQLIPHLRSLAHSPLPCSTSHPRPRHTPPRSSSILAPTAPPANQTCVGLVHTWRTRRIYFEGI
jgi:hypothetical protein